MASGEKTQGQEVVECNLCRKPVSFFCRRCGVKLCDTCIPVHLRVKSKTGHDVVDYVSKADVDSCVCDSHPKHECSAYCNTCEVPICILCVSIKHKSHEMSELTDKIEELVKGIARENDRLQSSRHQLETVLEHTTKQLSSLSSYYHRRKGEVTDRGKAWHQLIDDHVGKLHQELDSCQKESEAVLQKQKKELEDLIGQVDEINRKSSKLQKSKNVTEMLKFKPVIEEQKSIKEFTQCTLPVFYECDSDVNYLQTHFGYIEKMQERKISLMEKKSLPGMDSGRKILEAPTVTRVIDTEFPPDIGQGNVRLYDIAVTEDKKVWMGGNGRELKLFDLKGNLERSVTITWVGMYFCMYDKQVVFSDRSDKSIKRISNGDSVEVMLTTDDWWPSGITETASGNLLVCLTFKDGRQSKVVRYSSTGTVLQEIQYNSQCQPLYEDAFYISENVNEDIIVSDHGKRERVVTAVDRLGTFRYSYSGQESSFYPVGVATDSFGHVIVTDYWSDNVHMLDRDGRFLRYITPEGGIKAGRALCLIREGELIVGECKTGLAKRIKYLEEKK